MQAELPSRYTELVEVGQGGMAVVYRARDATLGRTVAVKVLHPHLLAEAESKARLQREAQAVAKLQHDNIVQIYDYSGADSKSSFIVTEFIEGQTLKQLMGDGYLPYPELAALIVIEVGHAVAHAHGMGILHRDIKPENVMVRRDGVLKLMDFGVAQVMDLERMTVTGQLIGSPAYMAPELIEGRSVDFRTDVFAVGTMLYQLSTGKLPFSGRNPHEVFKRITDGRYPSPRSVNPAISIALERVIAKTLARKPDDRYPTMGALIVDLTLLVTEAGFLDPRADLQRYFLDEVGETIRLRKSMHGALVESGRRARRERRIARALECWNRALALIPDDPEVAREIRRIEGGRRLRVTLASLGMLGIMILGVYGAIRGIGGPSALVAPALPGAANLTKNAIGTKAPVPIASDSTTPSPQPRPRLLGKPAPRLPRPASASGTPNAVSVPAANSAVQPVVAAPRVFELSVTPQNAEVWLDDRRMFDWGPGHTSLSIPWDGPHKVELRNDCCYPARRQVGPGLTPEGERSIRVRLNPKPAQLTVTLAPSTPGATVLLSEVGGNWKTTMSVGRMVTVPFDPEGEFVKSLSATVFSGESPVAAQTFVVRAGENRTEKVPVSR